MIQDQMRRDETAGNAAGNAARNAAGNDTLVVPVIHEEIHVDKRAVDTGRGVRVHKTVSEHTHTIDEDLLRDAVDVRRVPVDRIVALSDAPATRQEGDTLIVPVLEEVLVTEKRMRIKEEIHITRTQSPQRHTDTVVLRSERVSVERFDDGTDLDMHSTTRR